MSSLTGIPTSQKPTLSGTVTTNSDTALIGGVVIENNTVTATSLVGTLSTANQPNITGLGTLETLTVSGNVTANGVSVGTAGIYIEGPIDNSGYNLVAHRTQGLSYSLPDPTYPLTTVSQDLEVARNAVIGGEVQATTMNIFETIAAPTITAGNVTVTGNITNTEFQSAITDISNLQEDVTTLLGTITTLETKTQNITASSGSTTVSGNIVGSSTNLNSITQLNFTNALATKINLYGTSYGLGISSSKLNIFSPAATNFYYGGTNDSGTLVATVTGTGMAVNGNLTQSGAAGTLNVAGNIVQSGTAPASLNATTVDSLTTSGGLVYPIISTAVKYESQLGTGDITFAIPSWARSFAITFHQLSTYVAKSNTLFYIQPGSSSGYWDTATYCGAINVFATSGQNGQALNSIGYIPMTYTTVDTGVTYAHWSGTFRMDRMGFYGTEDIWTIGGNWYLHSQLWNVYVGGTVRGKHANQQLSTVRIVNNSTVLDNQKWVGAAQINYW